MDVALAIEKLIPAAKYYGSVTANTKASYTALVWKDARAKPTWAAIESAAATLPVSKTPEETQAAEVASFAAAVTSDEKIDLIAQKLGLK